MLEKFSKRDRVISSMTIRNDKKRRKKRKGKDKREIMKKTQEDRKIFLAL